VLVDYDDGAFEIAAQYPRSTERVVG